MVSTDQMGSLMRIADRLGVARLALVGDTRQLRAVEAGQPFLQLQRAGMATAQMDEFRRQRDPVLRAAVLASRSGEPGKAVELLGSSMHEVAYDELGEAAARTWLALAPEARERTLLLAPTHALRAEIHGTVRAALADEGVLRFRARRRTRSHFSGVLWMPRCFASLTAPSRSPRSSLAVQPAIGPLERRVPVPLGALPDQPQPLHLLQRQHRACHTALHRRRQSGLRRGGRAIVQAAPHDEFRARLSVRRRRFLHPRPLRIGGHQTTPLALFAPRSRHVCAPSSVVQILYRVPENSTLLHTIPTYISNGTYALDTVTPISHAFHALIRHPDATVSPNETQSYTYITGPNFYGFLVR